MTVQTCFEDENLVEYGFIKGECLSHELAFKLTGKTNFKTWTARKEKKCKCVEMVDIGVYNFLEDIVNINYKNHDKNSSLLIGKLEKDDIIKVRKK